MVRRSTFPGDAWWLLAIAVLAAVWSAIHPADYGTWRFEIIPGGLGVIALLILSTRVRFSTLLYGVVAIHFVVLAAGAKYTYADMPLFNWLRDAIHGSRNEFDRVGHVFQGLTVALLTRETLLRWTPLRRGFVVSFLSVCVGLAFSAFYELLEWQWVVWFYPTNGPEWLGMQGDPWDAQGDMLMALCGGLLVVTVLAPWHNRSIARAEAATAASEKPR